MKHTFLAVAFAVVALTGCHSTKPAPAPDKTVKAPAKKCCPKATASPAAKKAS